MKKVIEFSEELLIAFCLPPVHRQARKREDVSGDDCCASRDVKTGLTEGESGLSRFCKAPPI